MSRRASLSLFASVVLIGVVACESETAPPPGSPQTTAATESTFTVGDIFGALRAIHAAELEHGALAKKKATDPRVKAFAANVVDDHEQRASIDEDLVRSLRVRPKESRVSTWIRATSNRRAGRLDALSGSEFDRAYLDEQISYYRTVLDTFDKELAPVARNPRVKANIAEAREKASGRLKEAEDLRGALGDDPPSDPAQSRTSGSR